MSNRTYQPRHVLKSVTEDKAPFKPGQPQNNQRPKQEHICAGHTVQRQPIFSLDAITSEWRPLPREKIDSMSVDVYLAYRRISKEYWRMYWATEDEKTLGLGAKFERFCKSGPDLPNECKYDCDWLSGKNAKKMARKMNTTVLSKCEIRSRLCAPPRPVECQCKNVSDEAYESRPMRPPTYRSEEDFESMSTRPPTYRSKECLESIPTRPPTYQSRDHPATPSVPQQPAEKIPARYHRPFPESVEKQPENITGAMSISQSTRGIPARCHRPNQKPVEHQASDDQDARGLSSKAKALPARYRRCPARPGARSIRSALSHISDPSLSNNEVVER